MSSTVARVPQEVAIQAKAMAKAQNRSVGEVLAEAWASYYEANKQQIADDLETSARLIRDGDTDGLAAHMSRHNDQRAAAAAERANRR